jgi:fatty acid desaturase
MHNDPHKLLSKILTDKPSLYTPNNFSSLYRLFCSLLVFLLALYLLHYGLTLTAIFSFFLIGIFQYHLLVALHESCHNGLFSKKSINSLFARIIAGLLTFDSISGKRTHMHHHKMFGLNVLDPDYPDYIITPNQNNFFFFIISIFLRPFFKQLGLSKSKNFHSLNETGRCKSFSYITTIIVTQSLLFFSFLFITDFWWSYFLFWIAPLPIVPSILTRLRTMGEHGGLTEENPNVYKQFLYARTNKEDRNGLYQLRSWIECFFLAPYNFNYHHEHHLRPGIPYNNLPHIHKILKESGHYDRHPKNISNSYIKSIGTFWADHFRKNSKHKRSKNL